MAKTGGLNGPQKQHLLASCQYADKLLSEVESILHGSQSKQAFPKYSGALAPGQIRVIDDYLARIRFQMLRALESQDIAIPQPAFGTAHSVRVTLLFASIAFEDCTADKMRGYGQVPDDIAPELNGLVDEIKSLVDQLTGYLSQDLDQDPAERLQRLQQTGDEVELLRKLELAITEHGLVDYRRRLAAILDRLESKTFEIALFGRVSSGKSSLLNHIVGQRILPIGVNPITAVPTRLVFGPEPRLLIRIAGQKVEAVGIDRIAEFVTEQQNPANKKGVEKLVVEFPSERLKDGTVLVDTPGLGSLASAGAAETLAYLPQCDLGIVLIDAGSTLTAEDLSTLQALTDAAVPTVVLLSKTDLLATEDADRARTYISDQIRTNLRLELPVHGVSVQPGFTALLDRWFNEELAPLYSRHQELAKQSMKRKIGALRDAISGTLRARLDRAARSAGTQKTVPELVEAETQLRKVTGRFEAVRKRGYEETLAIREYGSKFIHNAASRIVDTWLTQDPRSPVTFESFSNLATIVAAEQANELRSLMETLARDLGGCLGKVSELLGEGATSAREELTAVVKEMPRIDLGTGQLYLTRPWSATISSRIAKWQVENFLTAWAGGQIKESFATFANMLDAWSRRVSAELQLRFNSYADAYRSRLAGNTGSIEDTLSLTKTLQNLGSLVEADLPKGNQHRTELDDEPVDRSASRNAAERTH